MNAPRPDSTRVTRTARPPEWAIPCPVGYCQARPGAGCTSPRGRAVYGGTHGSRAEAWQVQQYATGAAQ